MSFGTEMTQFYPRPRRSAYGSILDFKTMKAFEITSSLRWKILVRSATVIVCLFLLIGYFVIRRVCAIEYDTAIRDNRILVQTMSDRFTENIEAFVHQIDFVTLDGELQGLITDLQKPGADQYVASKKLRSFITLRSIVMDAISGVYLYDTSGAQIVKWEKTPNRADHYSLADQIDISRYSPNGSVTTEFIDGHLVYHRAVRALESWDIVAYISFLYDEDYLKENLKVIGGDKTGFIGLYDSVNQVLICADEYNRAAYLQALEEQNFVSTAQESRNSVEGIGEMIFCAREVVNDGWYLVSAFSSDRIYQVQPTIILMVIAFVLLAILVIFAVTLQNRAIIIEPIGKIIAAVAKVQNEDYDIHLDIRTGDEIELLARNFTVMAQRIDALVNQNLKGELQYKQAQFAQLQHQVKPHFLYNTFECINALSQLGRADEVRTITSSLATLMKTKMSDQRFTTVGEEFVCAEAFLQIYEIMYGENLSYEVMLDEDCRSLMIPSLIVQPIVENAVLHGIVPSGRKGICTMEAFLEDKFLHIRVSDDGIGFPDDRILPVINFIDGTATPEQIASLGVGLRNMIERVRLSYGTQSDILFLSDHEWGTSFELILPLHPVQSQFL